jgi:multicomponent Na+:H+ antiporter subunit E
MQQPARRDEMTLRAWIWSGLLRLPLFALLWWILIEGKLAGWWYGIPVILSAVLVSLLLLPASRRRWPLSGTVRFVGFFLWESLRGGIDVALRALNPRLPLNPDLIDYSLRLPEGNARIVLMNTISLLPGTLSANLHDDCLQVHTLDDDPQTMQSLEHVETMVAQLFGIDI